MNKKIAVLGDLGSIIGFRGLGLKVIPIEDMAIAAATLEALIKEDIYAIIFITEAVAEECKAILEAYYFEFLPAIIPIPAASGNTGMGLKTIKESVKKAIGFDIVSDEKDSEE